MIVVTVATGTVGGVVERLAGRTATSFTDWAIANAAAFR